MTCSTVIGALRRRGLGAASASGFGSWWRARVALSGSPDHYNLTRTPFVDRTLFVNMDVKGRDVTVVGAGPVGLVLAAELALSGVTGAGT